MDKNDLARLSAKYLDGMASDEEKSRLLQWYNAYDEAELTAYLPAADAAEEAMLEARMRDRLQQSILPVTPVRKLNTSRMINWAVAASVAGLIVVGGVYYRSKIHADNKAVANEIKPGSNKATLTLADGTIVALDSLHKGQQLQQGHTKVAQTAGGKLVYQDVTSGSNAIQYNVLTTPRGGQFNVVLADGTAVWLNAASSITYPTTFAGKERVVTITGEAYLEVAPDVKRPFSVKANGIAVMVLGTHFNINAYADEPVINTTLTEGAVLVKTATDMHLLAPGQQAKVKPGEDKIGFEPHADVNSVLAWKNGYFSFDSAKIPVVMRQLARWYNIEVVYEGKITEDTFTGEIGKSLTKQQLLSVLTKIGIHFKMEEDRKLVILQ